MVPYRSSQRSMFVRIVSCLFIVILALSNALAGSAAPARPASQPALPPDVLAGTIKLPPEALHAQINLPNGKTLLGSKLDSILSALAEAAQVSSAEALRLAEDRQVRHSADLIQIQAQTTSDRLADAQKAIENAGGQVTGVARDATRLQGWLPVQALAELSANPHIDYLRLPALATAFDSQAVNVVSEGLTPMNAPAWQSAGFYGAGVKVAIIDLGFQGYNALRGVELPNTVTVKNFVDGETDAQVDGTDVHGAANAEIVFDIAPQASMYLAKIATDIDLQEAVNWAKSNGVDVISTSLGWFNVTPGDGTGFFADLALDARSNGIFWATAAGNDRESHWGGAFNDANADTYHEFNTNQSVNYFGPGNGDAYLINPGFDFSVFLRWDDWTNVNQDYDLYLLRWNGSSWDEVASSVDVQNGSAGQTPTEAASVLTSGAAAPYGFAIARYSSTRNVNLEAFAPNLARLDEVLNARSLSNLADVPEVMTVAAVNVNSPYAQESYSSEGPTNGPGGTAGGGFTKPDISAYVNVSTATYGAGAFAGTSAATPHVAGAAVLVQNANPTYVAVQIESFLTSRAIDLGYTGMDNAYGYGRLYLGAAPAAGVKTWTGSSSADWHTAANWNPVGVPTAADDVMIPDVTNDPIISTANAAVNSLTINSGAVVDLTNRLLTVDGTVTNNGALRQTLTVASGVTTNFLRLMNQSITQTKYYGLDFTPNLSNSVTVTLYGNQFCQGRTTGVKRCYDISPSSAQTATVRFYFSEAERNGQSLPSLKVLHYAGTWSAEPGATTSGGSGDSQYVQAETISDFSPFALDKAGGPGKIFLPVVNRPLPILPPSNLAASAWSASAIYLSWKDNSNNETGFNIERSLNGSTWSPLTSVAANVTAIDDTGLQANTRYYYRVRAYNSTASSTYSNTASSVTFSPCNGGFEQGSACWTQYSTHGWQIIINSGFPPGLTPHGGSWLAWLGGEVDDLSYVQQQVTVQSSVPYLVYYHWIASADVCGYDFGGVMINGSVVDSYTLCSSNNTNGWVKHVVNLSAYVGQTVTLQIRAETDTSGNSNLYLDDVSFQATSYGAEGSEAPQVIPGAALPRSASGTRR